MSPGQYEDCTHSQLRNRIQQLEFEKAAITMNLRDEFAKASLPGLLAVDLAAPAEKSQGRVWVVRQAYLIADEMLKERQ